MNQPKFMVAVDPDALTQILSRLTELEGAIRAVKMTPAPEWVTATDYAKQTGVTRRTVMNWIAAGEIETSRHGRTVMVRANQGASQDRRRSRGNRP